MNDPVTVVPRIVGAIIAVALQVVLAPNIAIFGVVPDFIMAYALAVAVACVGQTGPVFFFVLGLLFDLLGSGPVGAMAFLLLAASALVQRAFLALDNDTLFVPLFLVIVSTLAIEVVYALLMLAFGVSAGLFDALFLRALPCTVYSGLLGVAFYPLCVRFLGRPIQQQPGTPHLR